MKMKDKENGDGSSLHVHEYLDSASHKIKC